MNRRLFLRTGLAGFLASSCAQVPKQPGKPDGSFQPFDEEIESFMTGCKISGGALAVVKDSRLVYTRAYGWADVEKRIATRPRSVFRIASISKPITAIGTLQLVEQGKLGFDTKAFPLLGLKPPNADEPVDARLNEITVRQLLQHTGGWDRDQTFDPMFRAQRISETLGVPPPPKPEDVIRYMLRKRLDFDPGTRAVYSNFGYCVLGRVIEKVSGEAYESFIRKNVLAPAGIVGMRIGATLDGKQAPDEVRYYSPELPEALSVFPNTAVNVPWPYGAFCLETMDAHGGWIASAIDLARFAAALHDPGSCPLLKAPTIKMMYEPPAAPAARNEDGSLKEWWLGCGWAVRPGQGGRHNAWHSGSLPGTSTLLVRRGDGLSWVVLFNQRSSNGKLPDGAIDSALHRAAAAVKEWPEHDLFSDFPARQPSP